MRSRFKRGAAGSPSTTVGAGARKSKVACLLSPPEKRKSKGGHSMFSGRLHPSLYVSSEGRGRSNRAATPCEMVLTPFPFPLTNTFQAVEFSTRFTHVLLWPISTGHALRLLRIDSATPILISRPNIIGHSDRVLTTGYESLRRTSLWRELCSGY